ncbi:MAG: fatty acid oxidation complex subunit alpha FadB [Oligoflexales bacterium]|nr:fatty acid oxidation complex subunit alpha FadB [Oligoflexales bacterium]
MSDTIFQGNALTAKRIEDDVCEIIFDLKGDSVNKFNAVTLNEFREVIKKVAETGSFRGVLITSGKDVFIVGADVTEFLTHFKKSDEEMRNWLRDTHNSFNMLEDLKIPSVVAINGVAFGGGFELCLSATYRVMSAKAEVGLPEVKLGIFPGWGGTIRLPRLIGADNAIEWICSGQSNNATEAFKVGAVDAVVEPDQLRKAALDLLSRAMKEELCWQAKVSEKKNPLQLRSPIEAAMVFGTSKAFIAGKAGPNYPAPVKAIECMEKCAGLTRDKAVEIEVEGFTNITRTETAQNLVSIFLSDQFNKKKSKMLAKQGGEVRHAAVLGAGIMGGGVAYQSAVKGVPIIMKDINDKALELGMNEASKLLVKQVQRNKIDNEKMARVIASIKPTLSYGDFEHVDLVVEAVVENEKIKKSVLSDLENRVRENAVITTNTSTISINLLASALKRPENFCGMHFFNPVHMMPLVEVIKGDRTSAAAVATTVAYATQMGKTPVVVKDCAGFLVNRVLFPYFFGFCYLLRDGVDFRRIDKVMEKFGWPMGPAYLGDVIGIDTCVHAAKVMSAAFPDRMKLGEKDALEAFFEANRYGQKNGKGFYQYTLDKKGKPKKSDDPAADEVLKPIVKNKVEVTDEEIIMRMMLPMINEAGLCLGEGIVETPMELDLALIYGLGFPPFRGGLAKYADSVGASRLVETSLKYKSIGNIYEPAPVLRKLAADGKRFYPV